MAELTTLGAIIKSTYAAEPNAYTDTKNAKLALIADEATKNNTDAFLLDRANQTGSAAASSISDFAAASRVQVEGTIAAGSNISIVATGVGPARVLTIAGPGAGGVTDGDKGDITVATSGTVWTIDNGAVTLPKLADVASKTFIGRDTAATGIPEVLNASVATAILIPFTSLLKGLAPASGGGTANYLRADGTWAAPAAGSAANSTRLDVYNATAATIPLGTPVYISGYNATTLQAQITTADADGAGTMPVIGLVLANILAASSGIVVLAGLITGVNTATYALNDPIYVSTAGALTNVAPIAGLVQEVARVNRVNASGELIVDVKDAGTPLTDTSSQLDVNGNKVLQYGVVASAVNHVELKNAATGVKAKISAVGTDTNVGLHLARKGTGVVTGALHAISIAVGDETTALTAGTAKVTFRMPYAFTLTGIRASVTTAPTGGALLTVDVNEAGVSIISTKLTFDATEKTTVTAVTPPVISDSALADDAEITVDIDAIGGTIAGAGLKVYLIGFIPE